MTLWQNIIRSLLKSQLAAHQQQRNDAAYRSQLCSSQSILDHFINAIDKILAQSFEFLSRHFHAEVFIFKQAFDLNKKHSTVNK